MHPTLRTNQRQEIDFIAGWNALGEKKEADLKEVDIKLTGYKPISITWIIEIHIMDVSILCQRKSIEHDALLNAGNGVIGMKVQYDNY